MIFSLSRTCHWETVGCHYLRVSAACSPLRCRRQWHPAVRQAPPSLQPACNRITTTSALNPVWEAVAVGALIMLGTLFGLIVLIFALVLRFDPEARGPSKSKGSDGL